MLKPTYVTKLEKVQGLTQSDKEKLAPVGDRFAFRANSYYLSLIDWDDPNDPIRRIIIPHPDELEDWGKLDASNESAYTVAPGTEHKYTDTAVLLVNDVCGGYCRFCFRKRIFMADNAEVVRDVEPGLEYIRNHPEITNVLLTGGDPLVMSTRKLENIVSHLRVIDHVRIVRIGSKLPVFNPYRVIDDPSLAEMIRTFSLPRKRMYIIVHFNHPKEITDVALKGVRMLQEAGAIVANQTPLLRGVNDSPDVLGELFKRLSFCGIPPYYVFIGRPTAGNHHFAVPVEEALTIFEQARLKVSGLAKRARLAMSHATGKIQVVGMTEEYVFFRYLRAFDHKDSGRFMVYKRNPDACWFDDYTERVDEHSYLEEEEIEDA